MHSVVGCSQLHSLCVTDLVRDILPVHGEAALQQADHQASDQLVRLVLGTQQQQRLLELLDVKLKQLEGLPGDEEEISLDCQPLQLGVCIVLAVTAGILSPLCYVALCGCGDQTSV